MLSRQSPIEYANLNEFGDNIKNAHMLALQQIHANYNNVLGWMDGYNHTS